MVASKMVAFAEKDVPTKPADDERFIQTSDDVMHILVTNQLSKLAIEQQLDLDLGPILRQMQAEGERYSLDFVFHQGLLYYRES